jgi:SynChlorMet cassette protein ScmC
MATPGASYWLDNMAKIMDLNRNDKNSFPRVIFGRKEFGKGLFPSWIADDLQRSDKWSIKLYGAFRVWQHPGSQDLVVDMEEYSDEVMKFLAMSDLLLLLFTAVAPSGGMSLHAALAEYGGKGVLFIAPGGMGKTTCTRRIPPPWRALCDDQVLVMRSEEGYYLAHPMPTWSEFFHGKSDKIWKVENYVALSALFYLRQSKKDEVLSLTHSKAAFRLFHSSRQATIGLHYSMSREEIRYQEMMAFDNACRISRELPSYLLEVSLTGRFWEKIEEVLESGPHSEEKEKESKGVIYEERSGTEALRS